MRNLEIVFFAVIFLFVIAGFLFVAFGFGEFAGARDDLRISAGVCAFIVLGLGVGVIGRMFARG